MQLTRLLLHKRTFSGIQPTGILHLGNYLGAVKRWVEQSREPREDRAGLMLCVVDQHAITMPQEPAQLRANTRQMTASLLACGLDTDNATTADGRTVPHRWNLYRRRNAYTCQITTYTASTGGCSTVTTHDRYNALGETHRVHPTSPRRLPC